MHIVLVRSGNEEGLCVCVPESAAVDNLSVGRGQDSDYCILIFDGDPSNGQRQTADRQDRTSICLSLILPSPPLPPSLPFPIYHLSPPSLSLSWLWGLTDILETPSWSFPLSLNLHPNLPQTWFGQTNPYVHVSLTDPFPLFHLTLSPPSCSPPLPPKAPNPSALACHPFHRHGIKVGAQPGRPSPTVLKTIQVSRVAHIAMVTGSSGNPSPS